MGLGFRLLAHFESAQGYLLKEEGKPSFFIGRAADECCGVNFHYTRPHAFCQAKFAKKLHKIILPELCTLYVK